MNLAEIDWVGLRSSNGADQRIKIFRIMQAVSYGINDGQADDPELLGVVPRLADLIYSSSELQDFLEPYSAMARATGLWNYIDKENADQHDRLISETVSAKVLDGITFHREQIAALNSLLSGKNLVLSAPTSFVKSLIIDALIASGKYQRIAIVLPTIALLDEFRRRLHRRFKESFSIVMHHSDMPDKQNVIFLGTQERLISRADLNNIDLTVVDEFYKLDPNRKDERSATLNAAVYKLLNKSTQFFFLGPNIDSVLTPQNGRWSFEFLKTKFSTVAVDTLDLSKSANKEQVLMDQLGDSAFWPALVFVSSPDRANRLAETAANLMAVSERSDRFSDWLRENVGARYPLARSVEYGFGVHHGRLPRAIGSQMVRLFNNDDLPILFCTSTLIEGVNTAAKSVFIFDKKISRSNYDFFTFSNIRGRAGRLGQHHVGNVVLFNDPPDFANTDVQPTLFDDETNAPDEYVVHLDEEDASDGVDDRISELRASLELDGEQLKLASAIGLDTAASIRKATLIALSQGYNIRWIGRGTYNEILAVCSVICKVKNPRSLGAFRDRQLAYLITSLRASPTIKGFLNSYDDSFDGEITAYDNVFKFLRSCEYGLPQLFSVVELFAQKISNPGVVNYSLFLAELPRWFRPEVPRNLDEEGIPIQISERFYRREDDRVTLISRILESLDSNDPRLSQFEQEWMRDLLVDDLD